MLPGGSPFRTSSSFFGALLWVLLPIDTISCDLIGSLDERRSRSPGRCTTPCRRHARCVCPTGGRRGGDHVERQPGSPRLRNRHGGDAGDRAHRTCCSKTVIKSSDLASSTTCDRHVT